ncbi:MAG: efflux RND transporter permease subunit, partial [Acidobacteriota bacterium]
PTAFLSGITGQFYRQFALTIAVSTVISSLVSLTLSPAMARVFLKSQAQMQAANRRSLWERISGPFFRWFNRRFAQIESAYDTFVCRAVRSPLPTVLLFLVVIGATVLIFTLVPPGFIPPQDQGYLIAALQLPDGASLSRTDEVTQEVTRISLETPGVQHAVAFAGFNGATFSNSANSGAVFVTLAPFAERRAAGLTLDSIMGELRQRYSSILGAGIFVIQPPSVTGLGTGGGFKMMVQDRGNAGFVRLQQEVNEILGAAYQTPDLVGVFSPFRATTPRLFVDVDRTRAKMLDVPIDGIFATLQTYLGSAYVNDFNFLGRTYRVTAQAEPTYRDEAEDITRLRTRSRSGAVVPLGSVAEVERRVGPDRVVRYNLYPAAEINGNPAPGRSTGEALAIMERIAAETLDPSFDYEWTELAFQEQEAASPVPIFLLCILFVFLTLAAQYESWVLPIAILLIVPVSLFGGILGTLARAMDNNILTQVGFVVLIGLAAKNAILIVEFARQLEDEGRSRWDAAIEASRLRLRPILMTSFAFVLGVLPLAIATGAGAEMRQALGTAVLFGMLGVTFFALLFTPVAYVLVRSAAERLTGGERAEAGDCDDRTPGGRSDAGGSGRVGSGRGGSDGGTAVDGNAVDDDLAEGASADLSRPGPDDPAAIDLDRDPGPAGSPAPQPTS